MGSSWTTVSFSSGTPQLLMKTRFDRTGYDVQLTDLSRIWGEALSKEEIIKRAIETGCSFNPGDDDGNYDTFLNCLQRALTGEAKTRSNLHSGGSGQLSIDLSVSLPGGLSDLEWTFDFAQSPDSAVATDIVGPLLLQANSMQSQIQQLIEEIAAKDHVIQKITDKFETSANDLTAVFPGASNVRALKKRSQSQRVQLAGHVRGLADFDQVAWKASNEKLREVQELTPDVMNMVLRDLPLPDRSDHGMNSWVEDLASRSQGRSQVHIKHITSSGKKEDPKPETQDEGFKPMETPTHLSKRSATEKDQSPHKEVPRSNEPAQNGEDSETDDEDCLDIPPTASQEQAVDTIECSDSLEEKSNTHKVMLKGTLEATRQWAKSETPQQPDLGEETDASGSPPPVVKTSVKVKDGKHDTEQEAEPATKPRKGGLGRFGGRKPPPEPEATNLQLQAEPKPSRPKSTLGKFGGKKGQPTPDPASVAASSSKPKSTLGRFGGKVKATSPNLAAGRQEIDDSSARGESKKPSATPSRGQISEEPPERELTEEEKQQRADEKREKLKRELDAKAKAPAKKKRKF